MLVRRDSTLDEYGRLDASPLLMPRDTLCRRDADGVTGPKGGVEVDADAHAAAAAALFPEEDDGDVRDADTRFEREVAADAAAAASVPDDA